ncbi:uncharacterized protein BDZ83DRAFT_749864 [Colletotrichum acutatum]|uniref:Uncharacterized protein n=1 Tax=Glomerella acutata TaxID=27357 RepID=A0AAD8UNE3_GLOAC|nr:uncharacterized protein BDZ83DRAFT_749864 [Colletotrichum acutatum]KAK1727547.1 hypothetical protein BDZ83DRAFT_749864 [Colletotrichum acutatum]
MSRSIFEGPQRRLVELLVLASAATAATISVGSTSLSLSNFQLITELSVPLGCLLSYNNPIEGCEATDFGSTGTCSQKCRNGLTRMQSNLQDVYVIGSADDIYHDDNHSAFNNRYCSSSTSASAGYDVGRSTAAANNIIININAYHTSAVKPGASASGNHSDTASI